MHVATFVRRWTKMEKMSNHKEDVNETYIAFKDIKGHKLKMFKLNKTDLILNESDKCL